MIFSLHGEQWKTYTNTNFINDVIGDSANLYCATNGGFTVFSRYEKKFTDIYTNVDGLSTNRINCLLLDKFNQVWLGTGKGIAVYNPSSQEIKTYDQNELRHSVITCLARAGDTILIGTNNGITVINTRGTLTFTDDVILPVNYPSGCSPKIFSIGIGNDFWVSACPGIVKLNRNLQTSTIYVHPFGDSVKAMTFISDTLYIASEIGLARFDGTDFTPILNYPENRVVFDLKYIDNKLYIATTGGLIQYDWSNAYFILNEYTRKIFTSDGLWLGMGGLSWFGSGLKHYYEGIWYSYQSSGLKSNNVSCAVFDNYSSIYAIHYPTQTYNFKIVSYKKSTEDWQYLSDTLVDSYFAVADNNNNIWFGHWSLNSGLSRYNPQNNEWQIKTWNGFRGVIGALGIDNNDTKWTYNQYNTIIALDSAGAEMEFSIPGLSRPEQPGYEFAFDQDNRVWLGFSGGLVMIDYNNTLFNVSDDNYQIYPFQEITSVAIDANNQIWCASTEGILKLENNSLYIFDTTRVKRVKCDDWGNVWFLTINTLLRYNIYTKQWKPYTQENCKIIPNIDNDDKFYRWLYIDKNNGCLLIATKEGISQFNYSVSVSESLSQIRIYPNPFIVKEHQIMTFDNLPQNSKIKIYSIEGKFIIELAVNKNFGGVRWQPKNLYSGIFLAVIKTDKKTQIAKFAVIR